MIFNLFATLRNKKNPVYIYFVGVRLKLYDESENNDLFAQKKAHLNAF